MVGMTGLALGGLSKVLLVPELLDRVCVVGAMRIRDGERIIHGAQLYIRIFIQSFLPKEEEYWPFGDVGISQRRSQ
jgi:hypothetical protein